MLNLMSVGRRERGAKDLMLTMNEPVKNKLSNYLIITQSYLHENTVSPLQWV